MIGKVTYGISELCQIFVKFVFSIGLFLSIFKFRKPGSSSLCFYEGNCTAAGLPLNAAFLYSSPEVFEGKTRHIFLEEVNYARY